jgi:hypothetical protein
MCDLEAMNKVEQTMPIYSELIRYIEELTKSLCCFMRIFCDGAFFIIDRNRELISDLAEVKRGVLFCERDITGPNDLGCKCFTWPSRPLNANMGAFHKNDRWHGITILIKDGDGYRDTLSFTTSLKNMDMQNLYISMKDEILKFVWCFYKRIGLLNVPITAACKELFRFKLGADFTPSSAQCLQEQRNFQRAVIATELGTDNIGEIEYTVYVLWRQGVNANRIAQLLGLSVNAVQMHVKSLQDKGSQCYRPGWLNQCAHLLTPK